MMRLFFSRHVGTQFYRISPEKSSAFKKAGGGFRFRSTVLVGRVGRFRFRFSVDLKEYLAIRRALKATMCLVSEHPPTGELNLRIGRIFNATKKSLTFFRKK